MQGKMCNGHRVTVTVYTWISLSLALLKFNAVDKKYPDQNKRQSIVSLSLLVSISTRCM